MSFLWSFNSLFENITITNFEEVAEFKYLGTIITDRNEMYKEIKHRLNSGNACYYAFQRL